MRSLRRELKIYDLRRILIDQMGMWLGHGIENELGRRRRQATEQPMLGESFKLSGKIGDRKSVV